MNAIHCLTYNETNVSSNLRYYYSFCNFEHLKCQHFSFKALNLSALYIYVEAMFLHIENPHVFLFYEWRPCITNHIHLSHRSSCLTPFPFYLKHKYLNNMCTLTTECGVILKTTWQN